MKKVYICSPYKAVDKAKLERNVEYARELTRKALETGLAPITPHLYLTQCVSEDKPEERATGMEAGLELLKSCDLVLVGDKHGISEGMSNEIAAAHMSGIEVVNADDLISKIVHSHRKNLKEYARYNACNFCIGRNMHTCVGHNCKEAYQKAYDYAAKHIRNE